VAVETETQTWCRVAHFASIHPLPKYHGAIRESTAAEKQLPIPSSLYCQRAWASHHQPLFPHRHFSCGRRRRRRCRFGGSSAPAPFDSFRIPNRLVEATTLANFSHHCYSSSSFFRRGQWPRYQIKSSKIEPSAKMSFGGPGFSNRVQDLLSWSLVIRKDM
jgi:hypothetical protein